MGDLISFRKARKTAKRRADDQRAGANRLLHGRSKAERKLHAARNVKVNRDLEKHRIETGDER